ncbi:hypothetical protein H7X87_01060 [Acetobacteraceae bacterium]|nr:hypothetical protein [Candidatus Parcubacteria bacterium]
MGKLEENHRKRRRRPDLQKIILKTVAVAGIMSVGVLAPNVLGALGKLGFMPASRQRDSIRAARSRLVQNGLLVYEEGKLRVTKAGENYLRAARLRGYRLLQPKRWDGRWRVLIFDIPEYRKGLRDKIRHTLIIAGLVRLQDSVWIFPHDCEELIVLLKADFKIGRELLYMIVDTLEHDNSLRKRFNLKS